MSGETDLKKLLAGLAPAADAIEYGFGLLPDDQKLPTGLSPFAIIQEREGMTLVAPAAQLAAANLQHTPGWAKITLTVHSSLSAVGLTAAVTSALAEYGISANVVAAYYHDHLFVPWNRREDAMSVLARLAQTV